MQLLSDISQPGNLLNLIYKLRPQNLASETVFIFVLKTPAFSLCVDHLTDFNLKSDIYRHWAASPERGLVTKHHLAGNFY